MGSLLGWALSGCTCQEQGPSYLIKVRCWPPASLPTTGLLLLLFLLMLPERLCVSPPETWRACLSNSLRSSAAPYLQRLKLGVPALRGVRAGIHLHESRITVSSSPGFGPACSVLASCMKSARPARSHCICSVLYFIGSCVFLSFSQQPSDTGLTGEGRDA